MAKRGYPRRRTPRSVEASRRNARKAQVSRVGLRGRRRRPGWVGR